ncbi:hypothetical protein 7S6_12 [uncultured Caudovirales phage]|uniref:Uncharacterized protein n=1 Tax=uncultured Caudovirales phage TaxID=2100421 RepID=A0A2H4JI68_9CAUD|nr:hypothetical protein 7S6_12 [uncultured Caudovirales phage]
MAFRITPAHDASIQIDFEVPIKGRQKPVTFSVPKIDYIAPETLEEYRRWFGVEVEANRATERNCTLKLLELTKARNYDLLAKLTDGELMEINRHWKDASRVDVGESSASSDS